MDRYQLFSAEWALAVAAQRGGELAAAERHFSRAHILGQPRIGLHVRSHWALLCLYLPQGRIADAWGQLWRMALVVPGTLFNRLPAGNSGLSDVNAFRPMQAPADLAPYVESNGGPR